MDEYDDYIMRNGTQYQSQISRKMFDEYAKFIEERDLENYLDSKGIETKLNKSKEEKDLDIINKLKSTLNSTVKNISKVSEELIRELKETGIIRKWWVNNSIITFKIEYRHSSLNEIEIVIKIDRSNIKIYTKKDLSEYSKIDKYFIEAIYNIFPITKEFKLEFI